MAANINPIFGKTPHLVVGGVIIGSNANTATDGTGSNMYKIFDADATEGSFVYYVSLKPVSTIAATVARLWVCTDTGTFTAGTTNTAANTALIAEATIAGWTASNTLSSPPYVITLNFPLQAGQKLLMSFGTSTGASTTGFNPITVAMKY